MTAKTGMVKSGWPITEIYDAIIFFTDLLSACSCLLLILKRKFDPWIENFAKGNFNFSGHQPKEILSLKPKKQCFYPIIIFENFNQCYSEEYYEDRKICKVQIFQNHTITLLIYKFSLCAVGAINYSERYSLLISLIVSSVLINSV